MFKWVLTGVVLVALSLATAGCKGENVEPAAAKAMVEKQEGFLLDVRTPREYAEGHIEGAVNIPVQELEGRTGELPKDKPIVVYCRSGNRSAKAKSMLEAKGFENVNDLGAMSNWKE